MTLNDFMIITGLTLNHTASLDLPKTMSHCTLGTYLNFMPKIFKKNHCYGKQRGRFK